MGRYKKDADIFSEIRKQARARKRAHIRQFTSIATPGNVAHLVGYGFKHGFGDLREEAYRMITNGEESQEVIYQNWFEKHKVTKEALIHLHLPCQVQHLYFQQYLCYSQESDILLSYPYQHTP